MTWTLPKEYVEKMGLREGKEIASIKETLLQSKA